MTGRWAGFGFAVNPAVFTSLVDLANTGAQVAGGIALSRDQRLAQQAALESQARLEAARLYAQTAVAQRPSMAWPIAIVAIMAIGAALAAAVLLRRRR